MCSLGNEVMESQNLGRERAHQKMEMSMDCDDLVLGRFQTETEMEKENEMGRQSQERRAHRDIGRGVSEDCAAEVMAEEGGGGGEMGGGGGENGIEDVGTDETKDIVGVFHKDVPPVDDVCPICFDGFTIPCRSNCGHWFCASCILQFWMYGSSVQPCKCPLCCCHIVNLKPEMSQLIQPADDLAEVLKKVHQYNGLYVRGMLGAFHRMQALPLLMGRIFRVLIDPDGLRCIYYVMRLIGLILALLYEKWEFEFVDTGGLGVQRMFDVGASIVILVLFFIGIGYRWVLRGRARRFAAMQAWDI